MRIVLVTFVLCLTVVGASAKADLIVQENELGQLVVLDDLNNQYWYWDLSFFALDFMAETYSKIDSLNSDSFFGVETWELASPDAMESLWLYSAEQISAAFNPSYLQISLGNVGQFWAGRYEDEDPTFGDPNHLTLYIVNNLGSTNYNKWDFPGNPLKDSQRTDALGAWVTAEAPVSVPEPCTLALFAIGLAGIVLARRRQRIA